MEIIFNRLYKIDISKSEVSILSDLQLTDNLKNYIITLLEAIQDKESDKKYEYKSQTLEFCTLLNKIIIDNEYDASCTRIADKLLEAEIEAQSKITRLKKDIQKGILIISLVEMTDTERKIIISKADYDEFLNESGEINTGLPLKKRIYKAYTANINQANEIYKIATYDSNTSVSTYWWKEFLELSIVRTDEENTLNAFKAIESKILNPIKKKSKADYFTLRNSTIRYFRANPEYSTDGYIENVYEGYHPFDSNVNINELKTKVRDLSQKCNFDNRFTIVRSQIKSKIKEVYHLSNDIDLVVKQDIQPNIIKTKQEEDGSKWVMINSNEGYEYFQHTVSTED